MPANLDPLAYPDTTVFAVSESEYMNSELFIEWFRVFLEHIPSKRPVLLLLDGHVSHSSIELLQLAKANNVILFCLPSHSTHLYQPLDTGVFRNFTNKHVLVDKEKRLVKH